MPASRTRRYKSLLAPQGHIECVAYIECEAYIENPEGIYIEKPKGLPYLALNSQKATALAAATFRESTLWYMGIFTV